jgi:hypothetical protein
LYLIKKEGIVISKYYSFVIVFIIAGSFAIFAPIDVNLKIIMITYCLGVYLLIKLRSASYECDNSLKDCKDTMRCDYNIAQLYSKIIYMLFLFGGILSIIFVLFKALNQFILPAFQINHINHLNHH